MNYLFQFVVVLLIVFFLHFINQLLLLKKSNFKIQWKAVTILVAISFVVVLLLNISIHPMEIQ